jgi:hypothetical protein
MVDFCGSDTQRSGNCINFFGGKERGMSNKSRIDTFSNGEIADNVFPSKTVTYGSDSGDSVL